MPLDALTNSHLALNSRETPTTTAFLRISNAMALSKYVNIGSVSAGVGVIGAAAALYGGATGPLGCGLASGYTFFAVASASMAMMHRENTKPAEADGEAEEEH